MSMTARDKSHWRFFTVFMLGDFVGTLNDKVTVTLPIMLTVALLATFFAERWSPRA